MINIICVGKIKENYLKEMIEDYYKRISKYHKINIIELKDENDIDIESQNIIKTIRVDHYVILCDLSGEQYSSIKFAESIDLLFTTGKSIIDFVIGGSDGVNEQVIERADKTISVSKMTFPHGLFRVILLEQIYRGFKILNNETYHK